MRNSIQILLFLSLLVGCNCAGSDKTGADVQSVEVMLRGQVRIGPTQPVATSDAETKPGNYKGRNVLIYDAEDKMVQKLALSDDGSFSISLPPGEYRVDMKLKGIEKAEDLPRKVSLQPGKSARVIIDIDTGIR
jgi:hypothetical protein